MNRGEEGSVKALCDCDYCPDSQDMRNRIIIALKARHEEDERWARLRKQSIDCDRSRQSHRIGILTAGRMKKGRMDERGERQVL